MAPRRPAFKVLGVPVFLPPSAAVGLAVIGWFALPTAQSLLGTSDTSLWVLVVAMLHGLGIYAAIFVHELGHVAAAKHYKYEVRAIVVHLIGGHTSFGATFRRPRHQFVIAVSGPVATGAIAIGAWLIAQVVGGGFVASVMSWIVWSATVMTIVNILPGIPLDGGVVLQSVVWHFTGNKKRGQFFAAIGGLVVAALWAASPWIFSRWLGWPLDSVDFLLSFMVGMWLGNNAWSSLLNSKMPEPEMSESDIAQAAELSVATLTRRAIAVAADDSCSAAIDKADQALAGAIVIERDGVVVGIVRNEALAAVPIEQRDSILIGSTARRISPEERILSSSKLQDIGESLAAVHAAEWLVVDADNKIVGVLYRADIDKKLQEWKS